MDEPQSSASHRKQLIVVGFVAAAIGLVAGFWIGRKWDEPHAPELPCPTCRLERVPNSNLCQLVGQIDPAWPLSKSPLELMPPFTGGASDMLNPGDCFRISFACPEATGPLQFKHHLSTLNFDNAWCVSGCPESMTCSP